MIEGIQPLKGLKSSDQVYPLNIFCCCFITLAPQASVMFKFIKNPEFVKSGARILFREGRTKGIGQVTQVDLRKYLMI